MSVSANTGNAFLDGYARQINVLERDPMKAAFELATKTNTAITILKTIEGAKETVAQQRPNIG